MSEAGRDQVAAGSAASDNPYYRSGQHLRARNDISESRWRELSQVVEHLAQAMLDRDGVLRSPNLGHVRVQQSDSFFSMTPIAMAKVVILT